LRLAFDLVVCVVAECDKGRLDFINGGRRQYSLWAYSLRVSALSHGDFFTL
jgi:hypothetical protein